MGILVSYVYKGAAKAPVVSIPPIRESAINFFTKITSVNKFTTTIVTFNVFIRNKVVLNETQT